jgi:transcriptional regulator with XRE-family HTH domain
MFTNETSYRNWNAMSDYALAQHLGKFIKHHRLEQNKTQDQLAEAAGMSRSTLSLLERGESVTLATFIQALRALDKLYTLDSFTIMPIVSPLMVAEMEMKKRKRARKKDKSDNSYESDW